MTDPILELDVADTGEGMAPEAAARLFQPFAQADVSTTRKHGGTGLGLVLSRRLARAMGGDVRLVGTAPGQGSVFRIALAVTPEDLAGAWIESLAPEPPRAPSPAPAAGSAARPLAGVRVLMVDDSADNRRLVHRFLTLAGGEVALATNGLEAVEAAREGVFDVVLMDIQMPEMDGFEATRRLRQGGYARPILALTAYAMREERERCLAAGFDAHLTKPIDRTALCSMVQKHAGR